MLFASFGLTDEFLVNRLMHVTFFPWKGLIILGPTCLINFIRRFTFYGRFEVSFWQVRGWFHCDYNDLSRYSLVSSFLFLSFFNCIVIFDQLCILFLVVPLGQLLPFKSTRSGSTAIFKSTLLLNPFGICRLVTKVLLLFLHQRLRRHQGLGR
jgi:hypothetical protein